MIEEVPYSIGPPCNDGCLKVQSVIGILEVHKNV